MLVQQILNSKANVNVIYVAPKTTIAEAAAILTKNKIGTVIISEGGKKAVGVLSERDIVRAIVHRGAQALNAHMDDFMTRKNCDLSVRGNCRSSFDDHDRQAVSTYSCS